jgi:hypothetical protein
MTSDFICSTILAMMAFFLGLWALVLGIGFVLSLRDDGLPAEDSQPVYGRSV